VIGLRTRLAVIGLTVAVTGCAAMLDRRTVAQRDAHAYLDWARQAQYVADYRDAERNYERALAQMRAGEFPGYFVASVMGELAEVKERLCRRDEAAALLRDGLNATPGAPPDRRMRRLFELAQSYYEQEQYLPSSAYFEQAISAAKGLAVHSQFGDPIGLAQAFDEYAVTLDKTGREADAGDARREAGALRARNPGKEPGNIIPQRRRGACMPPQESAASEDVTEEKRPILRLESASLAAYLEGSGANLAFVEMNGQERSARHQELPIRVGTNWIGLRAWSGLGQIGRPAGPGAEAHLCLAFVARPGRVYAVSVDGLKSGWKLSMASDDASASPQTSMATKAQLDRKIHCKAAK